MYVVCILSSVSPNIHIYVDTPQVQGSDKGKAETWTRQLKEYFQELALSNPTADTTPASSLNPLTGGGGGGEMQLPTGTAAGGGGGKGLQAVPELSSDREESKTNNTANSSAATGGGKLPEFPLYFSERDFRGDVRIGRQYGKLIICC